MRLPNRDESESIVPNSVSQRMVSELKPGRRGTPRAVARSFRAKDSDFPINISVVGTVLLV
jgi:hypothetical protein